MPTLTKSFRLTKKSVLIYNHHSRLCIVIDEPDRPSFPDLDSCQSSNKTGSIKSNNGYFNCAFTIAGASKASTSA
jgi:hypothetical protein